MPPRNIVGHLHGWFSRREEPCPSGSQCCCQQLLLCWFRSSRCWLLGAGSRVMGLTGLLLGSSLGSGLGKCWAALDCDSPVTFNHSFSSNIPHPSHPNRPPPSTALLAPAPADLCCGKQSAVLRSPSTRVWRASGSKASTNVGPLNTKPEASIRLLRRALLPSSPVLASSRR